MGGLSRSTSSRDAATRLSLMMGRRADWKRAEQSDARFFPTIALARPVSGAPVDRHLQTLDHRATVWAWLARGRRYRRAAVLSRI
jgi:hypothetical protein